MKEKTSAEENVKYFYDAENHLTRVETTRFGATIVVEYEYDAEGNRVKKTIDGLITTTYLVDENRDYVQVLEERDGSGNLLVRYVYGHDLISQTRGGATTYYHYDGLGSTRALTASSEAVTDTYNYDAFGNLLDKTGTTTNNHLFTGEFFDTNIGFYYLRARYMNPAIGRFVTMDSFAGRNRDPYSLHKYLYAHANPVNQVDPSGQSAYSDTMIAGTIIGIISGMYTYHVMTPPEDRTFLGYATWGAGGGLIGGLLAHGAWYLLVYAPYATTYISTTSGVWNLPPFQRGLEIEDFLLSGLPGRLPPGFKTFDRFWHGVATSVKSMDLSASTYQNAANILSKGRGYINTMLNFQTYTKVGHTLSASNITHYVLRLAVPPGATAAQQAALDQVIAYGNQLGVEVMIEVL